MSGITKAIDKDILMKTLKPVKSRSSVKKDIINLFSYYTGDIEDGALSNMLSYDSKGIMRKYKSIQKIIDRYVFVERHKSVKEQLKFFHDLHLAEHERKQLNYLRFIYWGYAYCLYYDKLSIKYEIGQFKTYLAEINLKNDSDDFEELFQYYTRDKHNNNTLSAFIKLLNLDIIHSSIQTEYNDSVFVIIMTFLNMLEYLTNSERYSSKDYCFMGSNINNLFGQSLMLIPSGIINSGVCSEMQSLELNALKFRLNFLIQSCWYATLQDMIKVITDNYEGNLNLADTSFEFYRTTSLWLTKRNVLLPNKGIILLINDTMIESIKLKEIHEGIINYMEVKVQYNKPVREVQTYIMPLMNEKMPISFIYKISRKLGNGADVADYIAHFLGTGLDGEPPSGVKPYEVISPNYWKYRDNNYMSPKDHESIKKGVKLKREYTVDVSAHLRKGNPSQEAKDLADTLCIELPEGYTIVREHYRTYNKTKKLELI